MLGADEAAGAGQGDVDGLGGERGVAGSGAGAASSRASTSRLQCVEALAERLFGLSGRSLQPAAGDFVEPALLAAKPLQAKGLHGLGTAERLRRVGAAWLLQRGKGLVEGGLVKCRQIGYWIRSSCVKSRINHCGSEIPVCSFS